MGREPRTPIHIPEIEQARAVFRTALDAEDWEAAILVADAISGVCRCLACQNRNRTMKAQIEARKSAAAVMDIPANGSILPDLERRVY